MNINFMIVFNFILLFLGVYLLYAAVKMKKDEIIPRAFVAEEEMKSCTDEAGFARFLYPRTLVFSIASLLVGIEGVVNDMIVELNGHINIVMIIVFLAAWLYFSSALRKGRGEYCGR
ncbi:MAG: hypothetical protein K6B67_01995 [Lachnospiraceae bacterium]|nr:hypothetical protein [Lachnospiraceae bacterium]